MLPPPVDLVEEDFERIEAAVMETERGRWFLQEYARRLRASETAEVLAAVQRLAARDAERAASEQVARRNAAEAAVAMAEALQQLCAFAIGVLPGEMALPEAAPRETPSKVPPPARSRPAGSGELDRRLAALKELDGLNVEAKVKLFG